MIKMLGLAKKLQIVNITQFPVHTIIFIKI